MKSLRKLLPYIKPYTLFAILGPLFMCIEVAMDLLQPTIMQHIIDVGIADRDHTYVVKMGLLMLLVAFVGLIGGIGSSIYSTKAAVHFATDIRRDVFKKTEQFSNQNTDSFGTGKLITIVTNDIATVQQALMMTLRVFGYIPIFWDYHGKYPLRPFGGNGRRSHRCGKNGVCAWVYQAFAKTV